MKLRKRQESKRTQALDALASVAKTWSEWQLAKRASKGIAKGAKKASKLKLATSDSKLKRALALKPVRIAGLAALIGGAGAAVAAKLRGGKAEPIYTPPPPPTPPSQPESPPALEDVPPPPPTPVEPDDVPTVDPEAGGGPDGAAEAVMQAGREAAAQDEGAPAAPGAEESADLADETKG